MITEQDPSTFLADFGVTVTSGAITGLGILDMPTEIIADGQVLSSEYTVLCETSKFGGLLYGDSVQIGVDLYEVRNVTKMTDGLFCTVSMSRLALQEDGDQA